MNRLSNPGRLNDFRRGWVALLVGLCFLRSAIADDFPIAQIDFFERHVRPILVERCLKCHGVDKQESGLRLDVRSSLFKGGDRGPAIVPGNPRGSLLLQAVSYESDDLAMPPDGQLPADQIEKLEQWIRLGAPFPEIDAAASLASAERLGGHWAFQPVASPILPRVRDTTWPTNAIDRFVLARLEAAGLTPSPRAEPRTLVRRAYFDLLGLPPTFEETREFARRDGPDAFELLVERLLARSEYGARWARHWLDVARYADTKGYVDGGQARFAFAYTYRDYVVRAFQEDLPFDQFVLDQLAADQLTYDDTQQWRLAAMGFLTVGRRFNYDMHDILDDRIDVISRGLMGLTVSCARCHDHKYDPIPTEDYYSLYGILASSYEPQHPALPLLEVEPVTTEHQEYVTEMQKRSRAFEEKFDKLHKTIQHELRAFAGDYLVYHVQESPHHREGTQNPLKTERTILRGPSAYGFGAIRRWREYIRSCGKDDPVFGLWHRLDPVDKTVFADELSKRLDDYHGNRLVKMAIQSTSPQSMVSLARCYGDLLEDVYAKWKARRATSPDAAGFADPAEEEIRAVLYGADSPTTLSALESIDCYHLDEHTDMRNTMGKIEEVSIENEQAPARAMLLRQRDRPYQPVVFLRGQPNRPGRSLPRRLPWLFTGSRVRETFVDRGGRLDLARVVVDPGNRFTARVIVNRVWHWHFGKPLVSTSSDFGLRSDPPTHPELLDYLAGWFMKNGWSLKRLHQLMMSSSTYQQASRGRQECATVDTENRLLWRFHARRLEWEVIRDSLLAISGRLERRGGGRPLDLAPDDPESRCRTLYLSVDRQHVSRFARNFDFPAPDFTVSGRPTTTVPQQQLFFLNSTFVLRQAQSLGQLAVDMNSADDAEIARFLCRRVLGREPGPGQLFELTRYVQYARSPELAEDRSTPTGHASKEPSSETDIWAKLAHALLQANELVYME